MDDGTAGDMVVSANYWKEVSKTPDTAPEPIHDTASAFTDDGGHHGKLTASDVLGGVEWRWKRLKTGNIKVKVAATGAEASSQVATHPTTYPILEKGDSTDRFVASCRIAGPHAFVVRLQNISLCEEEGSRRPPQEISDAMYLNSHAMHYDTRLSRVQYVFSPINERCHRRYIRFLYR